MARLSWLYRRYATPYQRDEIAKVISGIDKAQPIHTAVASSRVQAALLAYEADDGMAMFYQRLNRIAGGVLSALAITGLLVAAAAIFDVWKYVPQLSSERLAAVQSFILFCLLFGSLGGAEERWMGARTRAETNRGKIFSEIATADASGAEPVALNKAKFDLIEAAHGKDQLRYFAKKVAENEGRPGRFVQPVVVWSYRLLLAVVGCTTLWHAINAFGIPVPAVLFDVLAKVASIMNGHLYTVAILAASCLAAMMRAAEKRGLSKRDAVLYANAERRLRGVVEGEEARTIRNAARDGEGAALRDYVQRTQEVLREVHEEWAYGRRIERKDRGPEFTDT